MTDLDTRVEILEENLASMKEDHGEKLSTLTQRLAEVLMHSTRLDANMEAYRSVLVQAMTGLILLPPPANGQEKADRILKFLSSIKKHQKKADEKMAQILRDTFGDERYDEAMAAAEQDLKEAKVRREGG